MLFEVGGLLETAGTVSTFIGPVDTPPITEVLCVHLTVTWSLLDQP